MNTPRNTWTPPYTWEERIKYTLFPARLYMWRLIRRNLRKGEPELKFLPQLADPARMAIDVGANKGVYTHLLSRLCPAVHAFEPNPKIYRVLARALPKNVTTHQVALSDAPGAAELIVPMYKGGFSNQHASLNPRRKAGDHRSVMVESRTLDSYNFTNVGFIKIDVEGFEKAVLTGAMETLRRERPTLLVELEERHTGEPIEESLAFMARLGFDAFFLRNGALTPIAAFDAERDHRRVAGQSGYLFNFIFKPKG